jgi:hypothetical protein
MHVQENWQNNEKFFDFGKNVASFQVPHKSLLPLCCGLEENSK